MANSTTTSATDSLSSPVTILPLILLAVVVIVILVVSCLLYRRRKQMRLLSQLKITEKRIKVISGFLEKTDTKEENHVIEDNTYRLEEVAPSTAPPTSTPQKSPPPPNTLPLYQLRSHLYMGPQPIYASSSEISLPEDLTGAQTSMEVHCNDTPSTVLGRARRRCLNSYSGLVQHYNVMGTSAEGLGRSCNTAVQFPLVNSLVANCQLGFRAPVNTPVDCPSFIMPSQRLSYNEEDIDTSGTLVAPSQVFSLRPQYISCDATNTDTETEVWV